MKILQKIIIVLLAAGLVFAPTFVHLEARATITQVAGGAGGAPQNGLNTTGATLLVVSTTCDSSPNVSDSKSNTWTRFTQHARTIFQYVANPTVGSGHNFSVASGGFCGMTVAAFSGIKTSSPLDQSSQNSQTSSSIQAGTITPTERDELIVFAVGNAGSSFTSVNSGYTETGHINNQGCCYGNAMAYLVQSGAPSATNPTWTLAGSTSSQSDIASFKNASPSSAGIPPPFIIGRPEMRRR